ncbi:hypothetical protein [uncultured Thiodictyon sp.]|uniref:hypothetical protein n=1 Tax=uncultured Thiodictyon sp. TaxID=1846217 RepID=UPI0025D8F5EA|nr:hypothetical protein [uncultured Thiodictyon sp.]
MFDIDIPEKLIDLVEYGTAPWVVKPEIPVKFSSKIPRGRCPGLVCRAPSGLVRVAKQGHLLSFIPTSGSGLPTGPAARIRCN